MQSLTQRLKRRILTVPAVLIAGLLWIGLSPLWLPLALLVDIFGSKAPVATRLGLCLVLYFLMEWLGLLVCLILWLARIFRFIRTEAAYQSAHYALQHWWGSCLLRGSFRLLKLRLEVEGAEHLKNGSALLFMRHVSLLDTLLPAASFGQPRTLRLRYLLKKELLAEPCLDICGHRIPNLFVDRSGAHRESTLQKVEELACDLGPQDGVILYPEGTRFTLGKQARLREKLRREGREDLLAQAERLTSLLPVRTGGPKACFRGAPKADVLIVGHVGFEGAASLSHLLSGRVFDAPIRVKIWRIAGDTLPESPEARSQWLSTRWEELDAWIQSIH